MDFIVQGQPITKCQRSADTRQARYSSDMSAAITPYVPRLLLDWDNESPEAEFREIEGTLVFVDISGFTAMSERMAKKGKVGAEDVTEVLNETFASLLEVAYSVGGNLLKFGGDALLLFFMGDEHVTRACHAAGSMRSTLKKRGPIETGAGKVRLEMSIGVHTGTFHFFLVGESHRELIITSPEASMTVEMESSADAGEILVSESIAKHIGDGHLGERKNGGHLLVESCPAPKQSVAAPAETSAAEEFVPRVVREHILGGGDEPEHRQVTVGFIHFGGTDELIRVGEVNQVTKQLRSLINAVERVVEEHGICFIGTDIDRNGGKIILTAGAPQSTGNDEERMLRALRAICNQSNECELRIGVHRGHVFAGAVGPSFRRTYTVMGDAVNTAARVMSKAEAGQILATAEVLDRSETLFETEELEPFKVKGKAEEITAYRVGPAKGRREEQTSSDLPFIGRKEELETLLPILEAAARGQGAAAEIVGDGGLGKSRLLQQIRSKADGFSVLTAQCEPYESSTPYFPFRTLLRELIGAENDADLVYTESALRNTVESQTPDLIPWLPLIGIALDLDTPPTPEVEQLDERFRSARLRSSIISLLNSLIKSPTLFLFEDTHWMDEPSRELLRDIVKGAIGKPWAIYVTTRPNNPEIVQPPGLRLLLDPLPHSDSIALARAAALDSLLPQHADVVARRGGGNPLFVQALVAAARGASDLSQLPETIESAISAQIDELTPADRTLLRHMAVLGREIDVSLISEIEETSLTNLRSAFRRLSNLVLVEGPKATFRQALIRDAAYEGLAYRRRRSLHEKIGRLLEQRDAEPEILSVHFDRAESFEESWKYSREASERAWQKFAPNNVVDFSRKAILAGRRTRKSKDDMSAVWRELGVAAFRAGQLEEASRAFTRVRALTSDIGLTAWLFFVQGQCRERLGNASQALRWYSRGLKLLDSKAPVGQIKEPFTSPPPDYMPLAPRVRLIEAQANVKRNQGLLRQSLDLGHKAVAVAVAVDDKRGLAIAYNLLQQAYTDLRDPARRKYGEMALAVADEVANQWLRATILNNLAVDAYWEGDWKRSLSLYEASKESLIAAGDLIWAAAVSNNIAEILSDQGKLAEAEKQFLESLGTFRAARFEALSEAVSANLGRLAARSGDFEKAERLLSSVLESFKKKSSPTVETEARLAEVMVLKGDSTRALEWLEAIQPGNDPIMRATLHRLNGWALAQTGQWDQAEESLTTSLQLARTAGAAYEVALSLDALVRVVRSEKVREDYLSEKQSLFDRLNIERVPDVPLPTDALREMAGESHPPIET